MTRQTLFAAIGAAALMAMVTPSASAQPHPVHDCKPELIKATGAATLLGMGRARRLAINNWQREVRQKYGERYMDFTHARQANSECESASIGALGRLNKRCIVVGNPCAPGVPIDEYTLPPVNDPNDNKVTCFAQRVLIRLRYLNSDEYDCEYGPVTRRAVVRFQRDNRLPMTGELDSATLNQMGRLRGGKVS